MCRYCSSLGVYVCACLHKLLCGMSVSLVTLHCSLCDSLKTKQNSISLICIATSCNVGPDEECQDLLDVGVEM